MAFSEAIPLEKGNKMAQIEGALGPYVNAGAPSNGVDEVQTITPSAAPASGTYKLRFDGFTTSALDFDASAAEVQTALNALPSVGAGGVAVTLADGVYTVTFSGAAVAKRAQNSISVVDSALLDSGAAAVTLTVAEGTAGVTATALGALKGALLIDTTNGLLYQNLGTVSAPTWTKILAGITLTSTLVNLLIAGVAAGKKIAAGQKTTESASDTVVTGLASVSAAVAVLDSDPVLTCQFATASIGDQAGTPAAGSILVKTWMPTAANDATPIAATTFTKKVNWIAFGA
jgi:hypothetical protein